MWSDLSWSAHRCLLLVLVVLLLLSYLQSTIRSCSVRLAVWAWTLGSTADIVEIELAVVALGKCC